MKPSLLDLVGDIADDGSNTFKHRRRVHQSWWRTAILLEPPGKHRQDKTNSNTFDLTANNQDKNYLTQSAYQTALAEVEVRKHGGGAGLIGEPRIWNNLLSSQPLCFNFWSPLKHNPSLANLLLAELIPGFLSLVDIRFEQKPKAGVNLTDDNSAFDVIIDYLNTKDQPMMLGLECKYVDDLTSERYDKPPYREVFDKSKVFTQPYDFYVQPRFNQIFRNQLMACAYGEGCICGLFCSEADTKSIEIAQTFQSALNPPVFVILTYEKFIETLQRLPVKWETRKWSMLLWARYCGLELSEEVWQAHQAD